MTEKLTVFNQGPGTASFRIYPDNTSASKELSQAHSRKFFRAGIVPIAIPRSQSMDLVAVTGMPVKDLLNNPELHLMIQKGVLRIIEKILNEAEKEIIEVPSPVPVAVNASAGLNCLFKADKQIDKLDTDPVSILEKEKAKPVAKKKRGRPKKKKD